VGIEWLSGSSRDVSRWASVASHKRYQNLTKNDLKAAFIVLPNCSQEKSEQKESAANS